MLHPASSLPTDSEPDQLFRILAISGSLRAKSSNTSLLRALAMLAALTPDSIRMTFYDGLATLPYFNPDLDTDQALPEVVRAFRTQIGKVDAVVICSPEYAHGIPGVLKNALDWLVGSIEFPGKAVALLNASTRSSHAYNSLVEVLTTMSAHLVTDASLTIPIANNRVDEAAMLADPAVSGLLKTSLDVLVASRQENREHQDN